jgi:hypothetical protein
MKDPTDEQIAILDLITRAQNPLHPQSIRAILNPKPASVDLALAAHNEWHGRNQHIDAVLTDLDDLGLAVPRWHLTTLGRDALNEHARRNQKHGDAA